VQNQVISDFESACGERPNRPQPIKMPFCCCNCGQQGHNARNCAKPKRPRRKGHGNGQSIRHDSMQYGQHVNAQTTHVSTQLSGETASLKISGATKRYRKAIDQSTYLKATLGTMKCDCLLETGSEASTLTSCFGIQVVQNQVISDFESG